LAKDDYKEKMTLYRNSRRDLDKVNVKDYKDLLEEFVNISQTLLEGAIAKALEEKGMTQ